MKHEHGNGVTTKIWEQGEKLGEGTMGELYIFIDTETRIKYACKRISKKKISLKDKQAVMNEVKLHRLINHKHVCRFYHFFDNDDYLFILLEVLHAKNLQEIIMERGTFHEVEVQCIIKQILSAMVELR